MSEAIAAGTAEQAKPVPKKGPKFMGNFGWVRAVKEFGFPVVFGLAMLWIFSELIGDYRENVKSNTAANSKISAAVESLKSDADDKTKALESQTRALWELKGNSDKNLELHRELKTSFDNLADRLAPPRKGAGLPGEPPTTAGGPSPDALPGSEKP